MIFKDGLTAEARGNRQIQESTDEFIRLQQWHMFFAWLPCVFAITEDGHKMMAWLTTIQRRIKPGCSMPMWLYLRQRLPNHPQVYEYRLKENNP